MKSVSVPFEYSMTIREGHLDTFGHVNDTAYLGILEETRWEFGSLPSDFHVWLL